VMRFAAAPASVDIELAAAEPGAVRETRRRVHAWLRARGVDESTSGTVLRDVDDALSSHAEPEAPFGLRLQVEADGGEVRVTVDQGSARIV
jgi:hypothetical protein